MELYVSLLPEPHPTHLTLVGLLPRVDARVSEVVCVDPEGPVALLALVRFLSRVLELVGFQSLADYEPLPANVTDEGPLPRVHASVVVVRGFVEEGLAAGVTAILLLTRVDELVPLQRAGTVEALVAGSAAERRHVHRRPVQPIDNSAVPSCSAPSFQGPRVSLGVTQPLVFLQMAVVEEGFPTEVTHEGLGGAVKEHVSFQVVVLGETFPTDLTGERSFTRVNADVAFEVLLEGETRPAGLTREGFSSVDRLVRPQRPLVGESFVALAAFERVLPGVDSAVALQGEGVPEALPTLAALVRLLLSVNHLMSLQVPLGLEGFATGGTRKRPQVRVDNLVGL